MLKDLTWDRKVNASGSFKSELRYWGRFQSPCIHLYDTVFGSPSPGTST